MRVLRLEKAAQGGGGCPTLAVHKALSTLVWWEVSLPVVGEGWGWMTFKVHSKPLTLYDAMNLAEIMSLQFRFLSYSQKSWINKNESFLWLFFRS